MDGCWAAVLRSADVIDSLSQKAPPHDLRVEMQVLGSVLLDPKRLDELGVLRPRDFYDERNGRIFGHFVTMANGGGGPIDATLLPDRLKQAGD